MALYAYRAMNLQGRIVAGSLDAMNPVDLEMRLKRLGLDLITHGLANKPSLFQSRRINRPELINFCFHLEQLMRAGVPIIEALTDLRDSVTTPSFRETLANLVESIEGGMRLSDAMAQHQQTFDTVFVSLIRAGEQSGQLPEVLAKLAENLRWQDELAAQTKKLMLYPAFVATVMFVAFGFLMTKIVPDLIAVVRTMQTCAETTGTSSSASRSRYISACAPWYGPARRPSCESTARSCSCPWSARHCRS